MTLHVRTYPMGKSIDIERADGQGDFGFDLLNKDGSMSVYASDDEGIHYARIDASDVPDALVALQAWIEQLKC